MKKWQFPYISRMGRMYTIPLSILLFATSLQEPYLTNLVEFLLGLKKSFFHKKMLLSVLNRGFLMLHMIVERWFKDCCICTYM